MSNVVEFKRLSPKKKHKGKTLCREGFHKWKVETNNKFDTQQGRLVTVYKCERCGKEKITAH